MPLNLSSFDLEISAQEKLRLYDLAVMPGVVRPMALGFATNEILGLITHDPMQDGGISGQGDVC